MSTAEAFSYFWKLIFSRTGLPLANPFNRKHIMLEMDNLLRNLLRAHAFQAHTRPFGCSASRLLEQTLPAAIFWLLPCLRGLLYPSYTHYGGGLLSCCVLPYTLSWSSAIPPPAFSECVLYFSWRAVVNILNERLLLITQAYHPIKQIDVALLIVPEPSAAVWVPCGTLHCLFTFQNTCLALWVLHKN